MLRSVSSLTVAVLLAGSGLVVTPVAAVAPPLYTGVIDSSPALGFGGSDMLRSVVDSKGVNHVLELGGRYLTDRNGYWTATIVPGAIDIAADGSGMVVIATVNAGDASLVTDSAGVFTTEAIPGPSTDCWGSLRAIAVAPNGDVHAVWTGWPPTTSTWCVAHRVRSGGTWGASQELSNPGGLWTFIGAAYPITGQKLVVDGDGLGHFIYAAAATPASPTACNADKPNGLCMLDLALTESPTMAVVGHFAGQVSAYRAASGALDLAVPENANSTTSLGLHWLTNAGGPWADEIASGDSAFDPLVTDSPAGPEIFYFTGGGAVTPGLYRVSKGLSGWSSRVLLAAGGGDPVGGQDAAGNTHVAWVQPKSASDPSGVVALQAPDAVAPTVGAPLAKPTAGQKVGSIVPFTITWPRYDNLSGYAATTVRQETGSTWTTVASWTTATSVRRSLTPGSTSYAFRVQGRDKAGNLSSIATGPALRVTVADQTTTAAKYSGTWHTQSSTSFWKSSVRYASSASAAATYTFTGRSFAFVGTYGPTRGYAEIYVDGDLLGHVNTYRSTVTYRVVVWSIAWPSNGKHTITVKPWGQGSHRRIDVDGFVYSH